MYAVQWCFIPTSRTTIYAQDGPVIYYHYIKISKKFRSNCSFNNFNMILMLA